MPSLCRRPFGSLQALRVLGAGQNNQSHCDRHRRGAGRQCGAPAARLQQGGRRQPTRRGSGVALAWRPSSCFRQHGDPMTCRGRNDGTDGQVTGGELEGDPARGKGGVMDGRPAGDFLFDPLSDEAINWPARSLGSAAARHVSVAGQATWRCGRRPGAWPAGRPSSRRRVLRRPKRSQPVGCPEAGGLWFGDVRRPECD